MKIRLFKVGGAIRDEFLGITPKDVDYTVEAPSFDAMRDYIVGRGGKIFVETPKYFTIRAKLPDIGSADFVLARKDGAYSDGRHPDTVEVGDIYTDLARRDFTANAMARDVETGELLDPHNGQKDITNRELRFVGEPAQRLNEDKLRAFRALRFSVTKAFLIDWESSQALHRLVPSDFESVSTERIREELVRMFAKDSEFSFHLLYKEYHHLGKLVDLRSMWFKPTFQLDKVTT